MNTTYNIICVQLMNLFEIYPKDSSAHKEQSGLVHAESAVNIPSNYNVMSHIHGQNCQAASTLVVICTKRLICI